MLKTVRYLEKIT